MQGSLTLQRCFDLLEDALRKKWVGDFLLNPVSISDLSILTSKTHLHHAIVGKFNILKLYRPK